MAEVVVVMSSDEQKLFRAQQRLIEQQAKMERGYSRVKRTAKDAGKESEEAFGSKIVGRLAQYVGGLASVTAGVKMVAAAWSEAEENQRKALESMQSTAVSERALMQVAQGSSVAEVMADFRAMTARADELAVMSSGMGRAAAQELVFNARSAGFEDALEFIARAGGVIDPSAAGAVAAGSQALFGGSVTPTQAVVGTLAAAEQARFNFEQLALAMPTAAVGGGAIGAEAAETMAILSAFSDTLKSPLKASELMNLFGSTAAQTEDLEGQGFVGAFTRLNEMDEESRREILGRSIGLNTFFRKMEELMPVIEERMQSTADAMSGADRPDALIEMRRQAMEFTRTGRLAVERGAIRTEIARERAYGEYAAFEASQRERIDRRYASGEISAVTWLLSRGTLTATRGLDWATGQDRVYAERIESAAKHLDEAASRAADSIAPPSPGPVLQREANMHSVGAE